METEKTFEQSLQELEDIVTKLENQDTPLDKAMKLFEKGVAVADECNQKLKNAQQSIKILMEKNGKFEKEDFVPHEE